MKAATPGVAEAGAAAMEGGQATLGGGRSSDADRPPPASVLLTGLAALTFGGHMLVAGNYGYFRDELYYVVAGRHLAWGYVDFPPFIALLAALMDRLAGDALIPLHLYSALAGAALVLITGLMARELGGGRFAQCLAALGSMTALVYLAIGSIFSMDAWDELWWTLAAYLLIILFRRTRPRLWLLIGVVIGIGLLTKLTMLFFAGALFVALLLTPARAQLRSRWPWLAAAIAALFVLPFIAWQIANGWPTLAFYRGYGGNHSIGISPLGFLFEQAYTMNFATLPLWLAGLFFYLRAPAGKPYRPLGWCFVALWLLFTVLHGKSYFLAPAYTFLFAAGAVTLERRFGRPGWRWLRSTYLAALLGLGAISAPIAMPILPPATWVKAYAFLGGDAGAQQDPHQTGVLPQWLADRFGWQTLTATVAGVYAALPPSDRDQACIVTVNYGEASALNVLGPAMRLPPAISGHNTYALWGPEHCNGQVLITVGFAQADLQPFFSSVVPATTETCQYCMPEEDNLPIYIVRSPKVTIDALWPQVRHFS